MKTLMKIVHAVRNVIWIVFTGMGAALFFSILGAFWCLTIIGIPFGLQAFKFAKLAFLPHGKHVCPHFKAHPVANVLWLLLGGVVISFFIFFSGILSCLTIVGIPSGLRAFKFGVLALFPFGATIGPKHAVAEAAPSEEPIPEPQ